MTLQSLLGFKERQLFVEENREVLRNVQAGYRELAGFDIQWILGRKGSITAAKSGKDFAHVVLSFGPGVRAAKGQLLKKIVGAKFYLKRVVIRVAGVRALSHDALAAVYPANISAGAGTHLRRCRTWSQAARYQIWKI